VTAFDQGMKWLMRKDVEAGYYPGDQPRDRNPTLDGVTQKTYDRWRRLQGKDKRTVQKMEPTERDSIYRVMYWTKGKCEELAKRSEVLAIVHFDACVNHGIASPNDDRSAGAIELLQRTIGVEDDGVWGPVTEQAVWSELAAPGEVKVATHYLEVREAQYRHLAHHAPRTLGLNLKGWLARLNRLADHLGLPYKVEVPK